MDTDWEWVGLSDRHGKGYAEESRIYGSLNKNIILKINSSLKGSFVLYPFPDIKANKELHFKYIVFVYT